MSVEEVWLHWARNEGGGEKGLLHCPPLHHSWEYGRHRRECLEGLSGNWPSDQCRSGQVMHWAVLCLPPAPLPPLPPGVCGAWQLAAAAGSVPCSPPLEPGHACSEPAHNTRTNKETHTPHSQCKPVIAKRGGGDLKQCRAHACTHTHTHTHSYTMYTCKANHACTCCLVNLVPPLPPPIPPTSAPS